MSQITGRPHFSHGLGGRHRHVASHEKSTPGISATLIIGLVAQHSAQTSKTPPWLMSQVFML
jgi:hypothetical protein